jgi:hypothetical protein
VELELQYGRWAWLVQFQVMPTPVLYGTELGSVK